MGSIKTYRYLWWVLMKSEMRLAHRELAVT